MGKGPSAGDGMYRLGELARAAGVTTQTVQYYTMLGMIEEADRTAGGQRLFDAGAIKRVKLIHKLNESGYTLRDIRETFLHRHTGGG